MVKPSTVMLQISVRALIRGRFGGTYSINLSLGWALILRIDAYSRGALNRSITVLSSRSAHDWEINNLLSARGICNTPIFCIYCNLLNLRLFYRKKRSSNLFSWQRYLPTTCNYQPHENHETIVFCHQTFDLIWSMIDGCVGILLLPRCVALIFALCNFDESFDHNI